MGLNIKARLAFIKGSFVSKTYVWHIGKDKHDNHSIRRKRNKTQKMGLLERVGQQLVTLHKKHKYKREKTTTCLIDAPKFHHTIIASTH